MSDRFYKDIELPNLSSSTLATNPLTKPDAGFIQLYGIDGKLAIQDPNNSLTIAEKKQLYIQNNGNSVPEQQTYADNTINYLLYVVNGNGTQITPYIWIP